MFGILLIIVLKNVDNPSVIVKVISHKVISHKAHEGHKGLFIFFVIFVHFVRESIILCALCENLYYNFPLEISKNRSKNLTSFVRTLSRFFVRSPVGEKRDTGGKTLARAVPVVATLPLRNAFRTNT